MNQKKLSIIVPCYNEEESILHLYQALIQNTALLSKKYQLDSEILFIDDASSDGTLRLFKEMAAQDNKVRYLSFSRNFGKESAIYAGLIYATGDYLVFMDADLQDPPLLLEEMYLGITEEGYDCVATRRGTRKGEPKIRSFFARCFYKAIKHLSKVPFVDGARDYRMMTRKVADAVLKMEEYNRFSKGIFSWVGFETKWLEYDNVERIAGKTKWSFGKLFLYSLEGITAFSTAPLSFASILGLFCMIGSFLMTVVIIIKTLLYGDPVAGYPSMMCVIFFLGGVQLFSVGILGQYLSKIYLETKHRPKFILKEDNVNGSDEIKKNER